MTLLPHVGAGVVVFVAAVVVVVVGTKTQSAAIRKSLRAAVQPQSQKPHGAPCAFPMQSVLEQLTRDVPTVSIQRLSMHCAPEATSVNEHGSDSNPATEQVVPVQTTSGVGNGVGAGVGASVGPTVVAGAQSRKKSVLLPKSAPHAQLQEKHASPSSLLMHSLLRQSSGVSSNGPPNFVVCTQRSRRQIAVGNAVVGRVSHGESL
jgi:hypothetical protein